MTSFIIYPQKKDSLTDIEKVEPHDIKVGSQSDTGDKGRIPESVFILCQNEVRNNNQKLQKNGIKENGDNPFYAKHQSESTENQNVAAADASFNGIVSRILLIRFCFDFIKPPVNPCQNPFCHDGTRKEEQVGGFIFDSESKDQKASAYCIKGEFNFFRFFIGKHSRYQCQNADAQKQHLGNGRLDEGDGYNKEQAKNPINSPSVYFSFWEDAGFIFCLRDRNGKNIFCPAGGLVFLHLMRSKTDYVTDERNQERRQTQKKAEHAIQNRIPTFRYKKRTY